MLKTLFKILSNPISRDAKGMEYKKGSISRDAKGMEYKKGILHCLDFPWVLKNSLLCTRCLRSLEA